MVAAVEPGQSHLIAGRLLDEFRSLARLWAQSNEAIGRVAGDWPGIAGLVIAARDAMIESLRSDLRSVRIDPFDAALRSYLIASMGSLPDERLRVLFLDSGRNLVADEELQQGTLAQLAIYPRTIFRRALELNAAAIILVHNHPSGDPQPSEEDILATQKLDQVGRALDVQILDHIVVTARHAHHIMCDDVIAGRASGPSAYTLRSGGAPDGSSQSATILANAQATVRRRLLRRQLIGSDELFGEPAWDMLLDLFIHECEAKPLSMSSLGVAADMPTSSAMKLVQRLCDAGLCERIPDLKDGRRSIMKLAPDVLHRLRAYFSEGAE